MSSTTTSKDERGQNLSATFSRYQIHAVILFLLLVITCGFIALFILVSRIPDFRVNSATVNFKTTDSTHVTSNWNIAFSVRNRDSKNDFFYEQIQASVYYDNEILAYTMLAPFWQGSSNSTTLRAKLSAAEMYVDDLYVKRMLQDRSGGVVSFNVRMVVSVVTPKAWWPMGFRVMCRGVKVAFISTSSGAGVMSSGSNDCKVYQCASCFMKPY